LAVDRSKRNGCVSLPHVSRSFGILAGGSVVLRMVIIEKQDKHTFKVKYAPN
jgi:hypothetical protein